MSGSEPRRNRGKYGVDHKTRRLSAMITPDQDVKLCRLANLNGLAKAEFVRQLLSLVPDDLDLKSLRRLQVTVAATLGLDPPG